MKIPLNCIFTPDIGVKIQPNIGHRICNCENWVFFHIDLDHSHYYYLIGMITAIEASHMDSFITTMGDIVCPPLLGVEKKKTCSV